jgi:hypothetical protein
MLNILYIYFFALLYYIVLAVKMAAPYPQFMMQPMQAQAVPMQALPVQPSSNKTAIIVTIAVFVVAVILLILMMNSGDSVTVTPSTAPGVPAATTTTSNQAPKDGANGVTGDKTDNATKPPEKETTTTAASSGPIVPPVSTVKTIEIVRDTTNTHDPTNGQDPNWRTFQIGEVQVIDETGERLNSTAFSSVKLNTHNFGFPELNVLDNNPATFTHSSGSGAVHQLTLTLKNPTTVRRVTVFNRQDCCQSRLNGAVLTLRNEHGVVLKQLPLGSEASYTYDVSGPNGIRVL